jgi:hypothetical protein
MRHFMPRRGRDTRLLGRPLSMTQIRVPAERMLPGHCQTVPLESRGRRECRVRDAPAASCAKVESTRVSHHRFAETSRHSLRGWFTTYSVLSPAIGLSCHRPRATRCVVASSRQRRGAKTTRLRRPLRLVLVCTAKASTASRANVRDDAQRPSSRTRDARKTALDLPDVTSERPATDWHDGQISDGEQNAVNRIPRTYIRREPPGLWLWLKRTRAVW